MTDAEFKSEQARRSDQLQADVIDANPPDLHAYWRDKQMVAETNLLILKARRIQARLAS